MRLLAPLLMLLPALAFTLVSTLGATLAAAPAWAAEQRTLRHDGRDRRYVVEFPQAPGPRPAVIVFHGAGGTAARIRGYTDLGLSDEGWVEVYPDAVGRLWSDGRAALSGGLLRRGDDVGFVRALVAELVAERRVDPDRVFFAGVSNGGAMTLLVLCQAPELAAGAAVAIMTQPVGIDCPAGPPVPLMFVLGTADPLVPFGGGVIRVRGQDRFGVHSADETLAFYARRNRCDGGAAERRLADRAPDDGTRVRLVEYRGCAAPLLAFIVEGGGHSWPGASVPPLIDRLLGRTSRDISATDEIEGFLRRLVGER
jgi:polyhydroxybutyrate depolymerase